MRFLGRVICRRSDVDWPPTSSDITPLDFFYLKEEAVIGRNHFRLGAWTIRRNFPLNDEIMKVGRVSHHAISHFYFRQRGTREDLPITIITATVLAPFLYILIIPRVRRWRRKNRPAVACRFLGPTDTLLEKLPGP